MEMKTFRTFVLISFVSIITGINANNVHNSRKSMQKRSVRPTKSYEFKESDGSVQGMTVFQLDRKISEESYKIESLNRWVTVDNTGAVKVKEVWDYEQLGKEKTIDFWVYASGPHLNDLERQRIIIHIKDVNDENPYFINRPIPMQAVVQLNAPPGTPVFKLQAAIRTLTTTFITS